MIIYITYIYTILYIYTYPSKIGKNGIPGFIFRPWLCCTSLGRRCWPYIPFEIHSNWATGFFLENKRETSLDVPDGVSTSMVRINGLFHLLINGVYWGYNPFTPTIDPNFQGPSKRGSFNATHFWGVSNLMQMYVDLEGFYKIMCFVWVGNTMTRGKGKKKRTPVFFDRHTLPKTKSKTTRKKRPKLPQKGNRIISQPLPPFLQTLWLSDFGSVR